MKSISGILSVLLGVAFCLCVPAAQSANPPSGILLWDDGIMDQAHLILTGDPEQVSPYEINEGDVANILIEMIDLDSVPPLLEIHAVNVIETDTTADTVVVPMYSFVDWYDQFDGFGWLTLSPDYYQSAYNLYSLRIRAIDAEDESAYAQKVLWIKVLNVPQAPVLDPMPTDIQITEGDSLELVITYSDADFNPFFPLVPSFSPVPENTGLTVTSDSSSLFNFYPYYNQSGVYEILFKVEETSYLSLFDTQTVVIEVIDAGPQPVVLFVPFAPELTTYAGVWLDKNLWAIDPDGEPISIIALNLPTNADLIDFGDGTGSFHFAPDTTQEDSTYVVTIIASDGSSADSVDVSIFVQPYMCGDVDGSGSEDIDDVVFLLEYLFIGGPIPDPMIAGDVHRTDCPLLTIDIDDVVHLLAFIFARGGPPDCLCP